MLILLISTTAWNKVFSSVFSADPHIINVLTSIKSTNYKIILFVFDLRRCLDVSV